MATKVTPADPSTRRLSEVARHVVVPSGIVDTLWFEVEERCREFGDEFDAWQDGLGQVVLGIREDGSFAATIGGITLSIPRQVAKTFIVMRIVVAGDAAIVVRGRAPAGSKQQGQPDQQQGFGERQGGAGGGKHAGRLAFGRRSEAFESTWRA